MAKRRQSKPVCSAADAPRDVVSSSASVFDEPDAPSLSDSVLMSCGKHRVEQDVQRALLSRPELKFSGLVVRRIPGGVCLEGLLEVDERCPDLCALARSVAGVDCVLNHLVVNVQHEAPAKG